MASTFSIVIGPDALSRILTRMAHEIAERNHDPSEVVLVGIQRGGVGAADRLGGLLSQIWGVPVPTGTVDVGMHRDDLDQNGAREMHPTAIPVDINSKIVVLIDDVLFSGRTVRAAMDSLADLGRPKCIQLAVLIDRGQRELPIHPDFVGKTMKTAPDELVRVSLKEDGGDDTVGLEKA